MKDKTKGKLKNTFRKAKVVASTAAGVAGAAAALAMGDPLSANQALQAGKFYADKNRTPKTGPQ